MGESRSSAVEWPPRGLRKGDRLGLQQAENLIGRGAAIFNGYCERTSLGRGRFYAVVRNQLSSATDESRSSAQVTKYMSATLAGVPVPEHPWRSLEQPSLLSCFGNVPGSVSLNYWLGRFGDNQLAFEHGRGLKTRDVGLLWLLQRIQYLEFGLETEVSPHPLINSQTSYLHF